MPDPLGQPEQILGGFIGDIGRLVLLKRPIRFFQI